MNKIAVCITGEMRYWEITKHIFKDWDVDFFISTWDTTNRGEDNYPYKFHGNTNINEDILKTLKPKDYEFLGREYENKNDFHMAKYYHSARYEFLCLQHLLRNYRLTEIMYPTVQNLYILLLPIFY